MILASLQLLPALTLLFALVTSSPQKPEHAVHAISSRLAMNSKGRPGEFAPPVSDEAGSNRAS